MSSQDNAPVDSDPQVPTEWLANGPTGFGWGRTQQDALLNMVAYCDPVKGDTVTVDTVEHRGDATVRPGGWTVEEFVSGERFTVSVDELNDLRDHAINATVGTERLMESSDYEDIDA